MFSVYKVLSLRLVFSLGVKTVTGLVRLNGDEAQYYYPMGYQQRTMEEMIGSFPE